MTIFEKIEGLPQYQYFQIDHYDILNKVSLLGSLRTLDIRLKHINLSLTPIPKFEQVLNLSIKGS